MASSKTIQPVKLCYQGDQINDATAVIFVNTRCGPHQADKDGVVYTNAIERSEITVQLFSEVFEFEDV